MIVVDTSALIAILFDEPEKQQFENVVAGGERCIMSAVNAHETATGCAFGMVEQPSSGSGNSFRIQKLNCAVRRCSSARGGSGFRPLRQGRRSESASQSL